MKILIVDDQAIHRDLLTTILDKWPQLEVSTAGSGFEALTQLKATGHQFDLVFLDVSMPGCSGLDVLEKLQDSPLHRTLQFVMCTSATDRPTVTRALELGAKHYLLKPVTEAAITQKLRQIGAIQDRQAN